MKINENDLVDIDSVTSYTLPVSSISEQLGLLNNNIVVHRVNGIIRKLTEFIKSHNELVDFAEKGKEELESIKFRFGNLEAKMNSMLKENSGELEGRILALEEKFKGEEKKLVENEGVNLSPSTGWDRSMGDIV